MVAPEMLQTCPTVGVLSNWQVYQGSNLDSFLVELLEGICAAAEESGCNLLLSCGLSHTSISVEHNHPAWPVPSPEDDFVPVGPWNTDGLIVVLPFRSEAREATIRQLQGENFPVVYLGQSTCLSPVVCVDDAAGIRLGLQHLAEHGHRRIAFIAGDVEPESDSAIRRMAFREGMRELGLDYHPELVQHGFHNEDDGYLAMQALLQTGPTFSAVMTSDDLSGLGAMRALHQAGLQVPRDMALCGFDNIPECLVQDTPMTSVHYPRLEVGRQALLSILEGIRGKTLPDKTMIKPFLVVRQSCGCGIMPILPSHKTKGLGGEFVPEQKRSQVVGEMVESVARTTRFPERKQQLREFCEALLDLFCLEGSDRFQESLESFISEIIEAGYNPNQWQPVLTRVWETLSIQQKMDRGILEARSMIGNALLSEYAFRNSLYQHFQQVTQADRFGSLSLQFSSAQSEEQVLRVFYENLDSIGIQRGWVAFYKLETENTPPEVSTLRLLDGEAVISVDFPSRQFPPAGLLHLEEPFRLALIPLGTPDEIMGFVTFDALKFDLYGSVVLSLASALKSARLHEQVLELSLKDSLTGIANRRYFDLVMEREVQHCRRYHRALSVIIFDIDLFKAYNDTYGHLAGDVALKQVAKLAGSQSRRQLDTIARFGGDEFIVILSDTDSVGALKIANDILQVVSGSQDFLVPLTLSMGIATLQGEHLETQRLVEQADLALYQAKHSGRNLVRVFNSDL